MTPALAGPPFRSVIFDCDSTLSALEGIEALSRDHREEVERLTAASMTGEVPLDEVYARRLELARPDRAAVDALGRAYIDAIIPGAREVVAALHQHDVDVRILSGGLLPAVRTLAAELGVPGEKVAAVPVRFHDDGSYAGFDDRAAPARAGGKLEVVRGWLPALPRPVMLVGDGATDLEARPAVDLFVAFAGVADRPAVTAAADIVVRSASLAPILALTLGPAPAEAAQSPTYCAGLELIRAGQVELRDRASRYGFRV